MNDFGHSLEPCPFAAYCLRCFSTWYKPNVMILRMMSMTTSFQSGFDSVRVSDGEDNGFIVVKSVYAVNKYI